MDGFYLRVLVAVAVITIFCSSSNEVRATAPYAIYRIGTAAALGDFSLTLDHAAVVAQSDMEHGATVEIEYTIQNISPAPVPLVRFPALYLEDRKGGVLAVTSTGKTDATQTLAPGGQVSRSARFHVPGENIDTLGCLLRVGDDQGPRITLR